MNVKQVDSNQLSRSLVSFLLFVIFVGAATFAVKKGSMLLMSGIVALPFIIIFTQYPRTILVTAVVMNASLIPVPSFKVADIGVLFELLLIVIFTLGTLMGHLSWSKENSPEKKWIKYYMWLLVIIIAFRGTGLRVLGSTDWGGTQYIKQFLAIFFFFAVSGILITEKNMRQIAWGCLLAGLVGTVVLRYTGWERGESLHEVTSKRMDFLTPFAYSLLPLSFALGTKRKTIISTLLLFVCLILVMLTGFRGRTVFVIITIVGYGFFRSEAKSQYVVKMVTLGLLVWLGIVVMSPILPTAIQRSLSFVPGVNIDAQVMENATNSITWRVEIWNYCLERATEFLLIGRGVTFNVLEVLDNTSMKDIYTKSTWFMFETHSYHSGPLTLLIDLGIPGLIIHLAFTVLGFKKVWSYAKKLGRIDSFEARFALAISVGILWEFVGFYLAFGSIERIATQIGSLALISVYSRSIIARNKDNIDSCSIETGVMC